MDIEDRLIGIEAALGLVAINLEGLVDQIKLQHEMEQSNAATQLSALKVINDTLLVLVDAEQSGLRSKGTRGEVPDEDSVDEYLKRYPKP